MNVTHQNSLIKFQFQKEKLNNIQLCVAMFAQKIISDWTMKLRKQMHQSGIAKTNTPDFRVFLSFQQSASKYESHTNLVIVCKELELSNGHMLALSGQLSTFGQVQQPFIPKYLVEITIANCIAILVLQYYLAMMRNSKIQIEQKQKNKSILHKLSSIECLKYFGAFNISAKANGLISKKKGQNFLDGGAPFYAIYPTKRGLLAVGNLQPKFFQQMIEGLKLDNIQTEFCMQNHLNMEAWPKLRKIFAAKFLQKSAQEWEQIMNQKDTCVTAVKQFQKISQHFLHPKLIKPKI